MKRKTDEQLGMSRAIKRRDFVQGALVAAGTALTAAPLTTSAASESPAGTAGMIDADYPPVRTGMRGSHPGSYEIAHALGRDGATFPPLDTVQEQYDLIVVGAGISGLAAAYFYRQEVDSDAKILLLENHDDFGGHAKRNEFHQSGEMVLSLGGTHNLEWWNFSEVVKDLLDDLNVDVQAMRRDMTFDYGHDAPNSPAMWFDAETYGQSALLPNFSLRDRLSEAQIQQIPISEEGRASLTRFYAGTTLESTPPKTELETLLSEISYPDFLRDYAGLTEDAIQLFDKDQHGAWGLEMRALSAAEAIETGYPGLHLFGEEWTGEEFQYPVAMWPDGNASLARLLVSKLIHGAATGTHAHNIATARFDYSALDQPTNDVRLRLNSTVVNTENDDSGVAVTYVSSGTTHRVTSKHAVLACYHSIIPHLCPSLPTAQKEAMKYQVKMPLVLTNVLIRNRDALDKLGIDAISCPGRLHGRLFLFQGIQTGGYENQGDAVSLVFWGSISPPEDATDIRSQLRASRRKLLELSLEDFEREVRTVLDELLGPAGFDVSEDILAITVNRWPHGYAYEYMQLWDPEWAPGEAPHELARQRFGAITIANADAGASAYTHVAIDQAYRAVKELADIA